MRKRKSGLIGFPFKAGLDTAMRTAADDQYLLDSDVNWCLREIVTMWAQYLQHDNDPHVCCRAGFQRAFMKWRRREMNAAMDQSRS